MKKLNMKQLAKELNVSVGTVSKALSDSYEISELTKKKVLKAASVFNYTPNPYAGSLRNKKSKTIAVVLPEIADNFFSLAINGIQSVSKNKGYHVLIYLTHEKACNEESILDECCSGRVDGVLLSISSETKDVDHILKLQHHNIPVVFFDREFEGLRVAKVITNDFECGYLSASHLLQNGCKNPVFLSISSSLAICSNRAAGFKAALKDKGITNLENAVVECYGTKDEVHLQIKHLLTGKNKPDGIVASVERLAISVYLVSQQISVSIPKDLKVIVFSTLETAPILNPSLSTITQPAFEIGKTAAELLFKGIEKKKFNLADETVMLPSFLIERTSSKAVL
ncbi:MAG: LacI family DNA-binding transcriptional regulator [Ginsengibacter sp.]